MVGRFTNPADGSGRQITDLEQHRPVREAVSVLNRLLALLFPEANSLDIITVDDILRRYPLTGLGAPALAAIEQSQRILRARGDYGQVGLGEFHIGLVYLYWGDTRAAANQFALARQPWSLASDSPAICLAHYAQGLALYHAFHNEAAMMQFSRAERCLGRPQVGSQAERFNLLATEMRPLLAIAQETLRQSMWPEERAPDNAKGNYLTLPPQLAGRESLGAVVGNSMPSLERAAQTGEPVESQAVPRPISNMPGGGEEVMSLRGPVPGHIAMDDRFEWYVVTERKSDFLPYVAIGAWVLADRDLETRSESGREFVVVSSRHAGLGSILVQPVAGAGATMNCFLGYRDSTLVAALPESGSKLFLNDTGIEAPEADCVIVGVVAGLWLGLNGETP
jgi:hypothetical protein